LYILPVLIFFFSCKKELTDYYADLEDITVNTDSTLCVVDKIQLKNITSYEQSFVIQYDTIRYGFANGVLMSNAPASYNLTFKKTKLNDSVFLFNRDTVFISKKTQFVNRIKTLPLNKSDDSLDIRFIYDAASLVKKTIYLNGDTLPSFETNYFYNGKSRIVKTEMRFAQNQTLIYQSDIEYDKDLMVKPWLYHYTDFFNLSHYLLAFNFGERPTSLIKKITSTFYSSIESNKLGIYTIDFSRYKLSKDQYVLRYSCAGTQLNSVPYFFQNAELNYKCRQ
jgi:hypothetical protein